MESSIRVMLQIKPQVGQIRTQTTHAFMQNKLVKPDFRYFLLSNLVVFLQNEIFASRHQDVNSVACIEDKCYVLTLAQYCR